MRDDISGNMLFGKEERMGKMFSHEDFEKLRADAEREREAEKAAETPMRRWVACAMLISFGAGVLGAVIASIFGAEMLAGAFAVQVFAVFGLGFFIGCFEKNIGSRINGFAFPLFMAVGACAFLAGCGAYLLVRGEVISESLYRSVKGALAGSAFIIGGVLQVLPTAYYRILLKVKCTEPVSACCLELVTVKLGEINDRPVYGSAPIWQYYYDGAEYTITDNVYKSKGEMPTVGEMDEILIDPDKPERLLSRYCIPRFGFKPIFAALLITVGIWIQ